MKIKTLPTFLFFALAVLLAGCSQTLDQTGPYKGDKLLYDADQTIDTAYTTLDLFVSWEKQNAPSLTSQPAIHVAAERIRVNSKQWFSSAIKLRDAYAKDPTPANRTNLKSAIDIIQAALAEATTYLPK